MADLYDFLNDDGTNDISAWTRTLAKKQQAKLYERLDKLELYGEDLFPDSLSPTKVNGVLKLKCKGNVQLRPMVCRGPINLVLGKEYTLLHGAKEVGSKLVPADAPAKASQRKDQVVADPDKRRRTHEKVC